MQFQISELKFPEIKTDTETYVGIVHNFDSPFHLYINLKDLDESDFIRIIVYSMGAKKEIIWGTFNALNTKLEFRANCKYTLKQLIPFIKEWESFGYEYVANSVTDRIHIAMNSFNLNNKLLTESEYKILKYFLAYIDSKISYEQFEESDPDNLFPTIIDKLGIIEEDEFTDPIVNPIDLVYLNKNVKKVEEIIKTHEKTINRTDIDKDILRKIIHHTDLLQTIVTSFYQEIKNGPYNNNAFYQAMEKCESQEQCKGSKSEACDIYNFMKGDHIEIL